MGLFDTTATSKNYETTKVQPNVPNYLLNPVGAYADKLDEYLRSSPDQYITPINSIQQQVFGAAGMSPDEWQTMSYSPTRLWLNPPEAPSFTGGGQTAFGGANQYYDQAIDMTRNVADPTLSQAGLPDRYNTANVANIGDRGFVNADVGSLGGAARAGYTGYDAPVLGEASTWQGQGYGAATIDPSIIGDPAQYLSGDIERADAASLLDNFDSYMNPYLSDVVDTSLADYDRWASEQQAAQEGLQARNKSFGGSGSAIERAALTSDLARGRASTSAGLRSDAFNTAAGLSNLDAGRRQETGIFNASEANARDLARGQLDLGRAGLALEAAGINVGAINSAREFAASARNQSERDAATAQNEFRLRQAGLDENSARFLAEAANLSESDYARAVNEFALSRFSEESQTNRVNAQSENAALADTFAAERAAAEQNAAAENAARGQFYSTEADTERFNTGQANDMERYIASLGLDRAGQLGDLATQYGANTRADLQMQQDIGERLYELQQQRQLAPLQQLLAGAGLLDALPIDELSGKSVLTNGQTSQKGGGGLGGLLAIGSLFL